VSLLGQAVALHLAGRFEEVAVIYQRLVEREPAMAQALASFGVSGKRPSTQKPGEEAAPNALQGLIETALSSGDHEAAERHGAALTAVAPGCFEAWFNLGVARQRMGRHGEAAKAFERAGQLRPEAAQAHLGLAMARHASGEVSAAIQAYEEALDCDPDLEAALWNLGLLREAQRDMRAAWELYGHLAEVSPTSPETWFRLGYARFECGDFKASAAAYETCLKLRAPWPEASYNLGLAHWRLGDHGLARLGFEAALEAQPSPEAVWRALAALAIDTDDWAAALKCHRELMACGDRSFDVLYNGALLEHQAGHIEEAIGLYQEALESEPESAEALLNLGLAQKALGYSLAAMISCQKAIRIKPELAGVYFDRLGWMEQQANGSA
jgi:tetratricopeptide (TPR) repeat protein